MKLQIRKGIVWVKFYLDIASELNGDIEKTIKALKKSTYIKENIKTRKVEFVMFFDNEGEMELDVFEREYDLPTDRKSVV